MSNSLVTDLPDTEEPQAELPLPVARIKGEAILEMPQDLFIPPDALSIILEQFEGPLDLLLYLIRRHSIDILDIPMAELTHQYMTYIEAMRESQLELVAEYLLMAAMLIEIKSRLLLPRPPRENQGEAEDPRAELVRRLLEYEQMKAAAQAIDQLPRRERDYSLLNVLVEKSLVTRAPTVLVSDLADAWRAILARAKVSQKHRIGREELSVRAHMSRILRSLGGQGYVPFENLFQPTDGVEVMVVSFLAVLELARESLIDISQTAPFEPIYVRLHEISSLALEPTP